MILEVLLLRAADEETVRDVCVAGFLKGGCCKLAGASRYGPQAVRLTDTGQLASILESVKSKRINPTSNKQLLSLKRA